MIFIHDILQLHTASIMFLLMREENFKIMASEDEAYDFTIKISTSNIKFEQIVTWLQENAKPF